MGTAPVGDCAAQTAQEKQNIATTKTAIETRIGCVFLQSQIDLKTTRMNSPGYEVRANGEVEPVACRVTGMPGKAAIAFIIEPIHLATRITERSFFLP